MSWIKETEAVKMMNYKDRKYFRRRVKSGQLNISYRCNPSGRSYEYKAKDIESVKNKQAVNIYA